MMIWLAAEDKADLQTFGKRSIEKVIVSGAAVVRQFCYLALQLGDKILCSITQVTLRTVIASEAKQSRF